MSPISTHVFPKVNEAAQTLGSGMYACICKQQPQYIPRRAPVTHWQDVLFAKQFGGSREGLCNEVVLGTGDGVEREDTLCVTKVADAPKSIAEVTI